MKFSLATITAFIAASTLAAPAPEANAGAEASELVPRQSGGKLEFYRLYSFRDYLGDMGWPAEDSGDCSRWLILTLCYLWLVRRSADSGS